LAIDSSGNLWISNVVGVAKYSNSVVAISSRAGYPIPAQTEVVPYALSIDGTGNVWVAEFDGSSVAEISPSGSILSSTNGYNGGFPLQTSGIAVDGSGNVWIANRRAFGVTELIGAATPVVTPLSAGVKNNSLGTRP
jgi:streptogramin lyase